MSHINITESIIAALLSAAILAIVAVGSKYITGGALIDFLGGVTQKTFHDEIERAVEAKLDRARVDFRVGEEVRIGDVHHAPLGGVVYATLHASGKTQGAVCGYVAKEKASLDRSNRTRHLRAGTSIEYRNGTYVPVGSLFMPVEKERFWLVEKCSGKDNSAVRNATTIHFSELEVSY